MLNRAALTLVFVFACGAMAYGQCGPVPGTQPSVFSTSRGGGMFYQLVAHTLTGVPGGCSSVASFSPNGAICQMYTRGPGIYNCPAGMNCQILLASVYLTGSMGMPMTPGTHMCTWTCTGCPGTQVFQTNNMNGLPVELLDFSIDESGDPQSPQNPETEDGTTGDDTVPKP